MYDTIIIGAGPAGVAAAVYASRKKLNTMLITDSFGGQSYISDSIANWIGTTNISGFELSKNLENHARASGAEIQSPEIVTTVEEIDNSFEILTNKNSSYQTKTVIIATGGRRRKLGVPGEDKFAGRGITYCSTCDSPLFRNKTVAVIGGGNSGLEAVVDLISYADKIYLLIRSDKLKGDPVVQEEVMKSPKVTIIFNAQIQTVLGESAVIGLRYLDTISREVKELAVQGIFVEIGSAPNSDLVKDLVELNQSGEIIVNHKTCATSKPGIFAAGDVIDSIYKQNNISAGMGVIAALSTYNYLLNLKSTII
jgi:alkyl hydroperoxide reductase subunit F